MSNTSSATVDEGGLTSGAPGDLYGTGNDAGAETSASVSLSGSVQFGADGPAATPFQFVDHATADTWLSGLNLTSHGQAVDFAQIVGSELIAWTGGGPTDPNAHEVFSVTLSGSDYTFQLINPFDDPTGNGENSVTLNLSGLIQAVDFDGDAVTLSGGAQITVIDDVPVAQGNLIENGNFLGGNFAPTFYGGVITVTDGSGGIDWLLATSSEASPSNQAQPGFVEMERVHSGYLGSFMPDGHPMIDMDATPGDIQISQAVHGITTGQTYQLEFFTAATTPPGDTAPTAVLDVLWGGQVIETITTTSETPTPHLIDVIGGAGDGTNTLTFAEIGTADTYGTYLGDVSLEAGTPMGVVDEGGLTTPFQGNDPGAPTSASGSIAGLVSFGADGPAETLGSPNVVNGFQFVTNTQAIVAGMGLSSEGSTIDHVTLTSNPNQPDGGLETTSTTLEAFTQNGHEAFTMTLEGDGAWQFQLLAPLDNPAPPQGAGEDSTIIDFSKLVDALDFDGDTTALVSGSFTVDVVDDVPTASSVSTSMFENTASLTVTPANGVNFSYGADGPGTVTFDTADATITSDPTGGHLVLPTAGQYTINGNSITLDPGTDFQALAAGESATLEIPYTVTDHDGDTSTSDIFVTVNGVNDPPTTANNTVTTAGEHGLYVPRLRLPVLRSDRHAAQRSAGCHCHVAALARDPDRPRQCGHRERGDLGRRASPDGDLRLHAGGEQHRDPDLPVRGPGRWRHRQRRSRHLGRSHHDHRRHGAAGHDHDQ